MKDSEKVFPEWKQDAFGKMLFRNLWGGINKVINWHRLLSLSPKRRLIFLPAGHINPKDK